MEYLVIFLFILYIKDNVLVPDRAVHGRILDMTQLSLIS